MDCWISPGSTPGRLQLIWRRSRWRPCFSLCTWLAVCSDRRLLRRGLQNLLANAIRYTARGGVLLGLRRRGGEVELQLIDSGPGIALEHRALILEEFRRLEAGSTEDQKALGLGLGPSICERIARLLKHPLASRPGPGSAFSVRVPV